jgi:hydrogenase expression/formation protein HypE
MHARTLGVGKLPMDFLQTLLERFGGQHEQLIVGPRVGEDAAVLDFGDRYLVAKSDPITFATDEIGWYVVHINANDIVSMGASPRWLLLTLLLPEKETTRTLVEDIFTQVSQACESLEIVLCGGHTEITHGLDRPIAVGLMLGEVEKANLVCSAGAQAGDDVLLTKGIAIEGTAVLARELGDRLADTVGYDVLAHGQQFLRWPGISVVRDAKIVCQITQPHSMHDPTEGGLATGLWELAEASKKGIVVDVDMIHVFPETLAVCRALNLDPLGLIASGALLVTTSPKDSRRVVDGLESAGIVARVIGRVVEGPPKVQMRTAGGLTPFPVFKRDELARVFG